MMPVDIKQAIEHIVDNRIKYLRHYYGQVINADDPEKIGRVLVAVPDLGWFDVDSSSWAFPRGDFRVPELDAWVEVYFMNGNPAQPVYMGIAPEMAAMLPFSFDGKKETKLIYSDEKTKTAIVFEQLNKLLKIVLGDGVNVKIGAGTESFIKGDTAKTELTKDQAAMTELQSAINTWVPVPADGGAALKVALAAFLAKPMANYANILSTRIKGE